MCECVCKHVCVCACVFISVCMGVVVASVENLTIFLLHLEALSHSSDHTRHFVKFSHEG